MTQAKNKDVIKKLQELDPEADVVVNSCGEYSLLEFVEIKTAENCEGSGDSVSVIYEIDGNTKMIVLTDGYK